MRNALLLLIVLVLSLSIYFYFSRTQPTPDLYGKNFNAIRLKMHVPIIEDSWVIRTQDSSHTQWSHASLYNKQNIPEHIWKTLYFRGTTLASEEDAFNYDQGDSIGDRLIIVSSLQNSDSIKCKFSRHYYRSYPPSRSVTVTREFADSVLRRWGFTNLYTNKDKSRID